MNYARITWAMLWKDSKTMAYLWAVITLLAGISLYLFSLKTDPSLDAAYREIAMWIACSVPLVMAMSSGALLVGTEKEARTFDWLTSLPLSWWMVGGAKVLASLLALAGAWSTTLILYSGFLLLKGDIQAMPWGELYCLMSFSLLVLGFSLILSWFTRSTILGTLLVLPCGAGAWHLLPRIVEHPWNAGLLFLLSGFGMLLSFFWLVKKLWRQESRWLPNRLAFIRENTPSIDLKELRSTRQSTALLWESWHQTKIPLLLFGVIVGFVGSLATRWQAPEPVWAVLLGSGVLGTVVYLREGVQFHVNRGLSMNLFWITRHLLPLAGLLLGWLLLCGAIFVASPRYYGFDFLRNVLSLESDDSLSWVLLFLMFGCYTLGQFVGFWIQRASIGYAATLVTCVCCLAFANLLFGPYLSQSKVYLVYAGLFYLPLLLVPRVMLKHWMEHRLCWRFHWVMSFSIFGGIVLCVAGLTVSRLQWLPPEFEPPEQLVGLSVNTPRSTSTAIDARVQGTSHRVPHPNPVDGANNLQALRLEDTVLVRQVHLDALKIREQPNSAATLPELTHLQELLKRSSQPSAYQLCFETERAIVQHLLHPNTISLNHATRIKAIEALRTQPEIHSHLKKVVDRLLRTLESDDGLDDAVRLLGGAPHQLQWTPLLALERHLMKRWMRYSLSQVLVESQQLLQTLNERSPANHSAEMPECDEERWLRCTDWRAILSTDRTSGSWDSIRMPEFAPRAQRSWREEANLIALHQLLLKTSDEGASQ